MRMYLFMYVCIWSNIEYFCILYFSFFLIRAILCIYKYFNCPLFNQFSMDKMNILFHTEIRHIKETKCDAGVASWWLQLNLVSAQILFISLTHWLFGCSFKNTHNIKHLLLRRVLNDDGILSKQHPTRPLPPDSLPRRCHAHTHTHTHTHTHVRPACLWIGGQRTTGSLQLSPAIFSHTQARWMMPTSIFSALLFNSMTAHLKGNKSYRLWGVRTHKEGENVLWSIYMWVWLFICLCIGLCLSESVSV